METNPCNLFNLNLFLYLFTYLFLYRLLLTTKRININTALLNFNLNGLRNYLEYFGRENVTWILMNAKGFFPFCVKTDLHILLRPDRLMVLILPLIQSKLIYIFLLFSLYVETIIGVLQVWKLLYDIEGDGVFPTLHDTMTYIPMSYNSKVSECSRTPGNIQIHCNKNRRFPPFLMYRIVQKKHIPSNTCKLSNKQSNYTLKRHLTPFFFFFYKYDGFWRTYGIHLGRRL